MKAQYNSHLKNINTIAMKNCLQITVTSVNPRLDFGFKNAQVQKHWHIE
jgi:hypothetical protein